MQLGHYAQVSWTTGLNPRPRLVRSADMNKDQTYYLSSVPETKLRRVRPLNFVIRGDLQSCQLFRRYFLSDTSPNHKFESSPILSDSRQQREMRVWAFAL